MEQKMLEETLLNSLKSISDRLYEIESTLGQIVRLEERMNNYDSVLARFGNRLDTNDDRMRELELSNSKRASQDDFIHITNSLKSDISDLSTQLAINNGQKDVGKEVLKWLSGILSLLTIYILTNWGPINGG